MSKAWTKQQRMKFTATMNKKKKAAKITHIPLEVVPDAQPPMRKYKPRVPSSGPTMLDILAQLLISTATQLARFPNSRE